MLLNNWRINTDRRRIMQTSIRAKTSLRYLEQKVLSSPRKYGAVASTSRLDLYCLSAVAGHVGCYNAF